MMHIIDRFLIHFFASMGIVTAGLFALRCVQRKTQWAWLPHLIQPQLILVSLAVFAVSALREAYDVANGQSLVKAITDYVSWAGGCTVSAWALWRVRTLT